MADRQHIETRMQEITFLIEQSTEQIRAGRMISLHHLDDEVASLCDAAISLPPDEAGQLQAPMATMINKLEELAGALREYQQKKKGV